MKCQNINLHLVFNPANTYVYLYSWDKVRECQVRPHYKYMHKCLHDQSPLYLQLHSQIYTFCLRLLGCRILKFQGKEVYLI